LPRTTQVACLLHALEAQVNNGGFHQFLSNPTGYLALDTIAALHEIGATRTRQLLESAIRVAYPNGYPEDPSRHEDVADDDATFDDLDELDAAFYRYEEPLSDLVNQYLQAIN